MLFGYLFEIFNLERKELPLLAELILLILTFKGGSVLGDTLRPFVFFFLFGVASLVVKSKDLVTLGAYCSFLSLDVFCIDLGVLGHY